MCIYICRQIDVYMLIYIYMIGQRIPCNAQISLLLQRLGPWARAMGEGYGPGPWAGALEPHSMTRFRDRIRVQYATRKS